MPGEGTFPFKKFLRPYFQKSGTTNYIITKIEVPDNSKGTPRARKMS